MGKNSSRHGTIPTRTPPARRRTDPWVTLLTATVALLGLAAPAQSTTLTTPIPVTHPEQLAATRFGGAVATDGTNFLVGARLDDTGGQDVGAAFLFDGAGARLRTLRTRPALAGMQLGFAAVIAGADPIVGTPHYPNSFPHSGVTLVFNTIKLTKGSFASSLADEALIDDTVADVAVLMPVGIKLNDTMYAKAQPQIYRARAGKTGKAK